MTYSKIKRCSALEAFLGLAAAGVALLFQGCSDLKAHYGILPSEGEWHFYTPPRLPQDSTEEAIVRSAKEMAPIPLQTVTAEYIDSTYDRTYTHTYSFVDLVSKPQKGDSRYTPRSITRYQVLGDKISAKTNTTEEIFPSADFERSVIKNAGMVKSPTRVLLYNDGDNSVTMHSEMEGGCLVTVKIFGRNGKGGSGELIAEKPVNFCVREPKGD